MIIKIQTKTETFDLKQIGCFLLAYPVNAHTHYM